jgi:ABC-type Na+ transport system ATPase subunit NatA
LLRADAGTARVNGFDVRKQPDKVRESIGLTGQFASVDEDLTGVQNLVMIGQLLDLPKRAARQRADELLAWFDLSAAGNKVAKTYSGGMRRRLDLAASLVGRPQVIFLDEPTTGLDPAKREDMWDVVRSLVSDGSTVLLTTQYLEEADALADEITVIDHGLVIAHDTPHGLKRVLGGQRLTVRPADPARRTISATCCSVSPGTPRRMMRLPSGRGQRPHQQPGELLVQWVFRGQRLKLADAGGGPARVEFLAEKDDRRVQPQILKPAGERLGEIPGIRQGRPAPQRQGLGHRPLGDEPLEAQRVHVVGHHRQPVPGRRLFHRRWLAQSLAGPRDQGLQRVRHIGGKRAVPDCLG